MIRHYGIRNTLEGLRPGSQQAQLVDLLRDLGYEPDHMPSDGPIGADGYTAFVAPGTKVQPTHAAKPGQKLTEFKPWTDIRHWAQIRRALNVDVQGAIQHPSIAFYVDETGAQQ